MRFKKVVAFLLLLTILTTLYVPSIVKSRESFEIIAPSKVKAGEQFTFTIRSTDLLEYTGISFSTDSERSDLPEKVLLPKGFESVNLKARFFDAGEHFLKAYSLKNPSKYAVVKIDVQPSDPQFGSIFPNYTGIKEGECIRFKTTITDKYGNLIRDANPVFSVETVSGKANFKFVGGELYAIGSGECKVYLLVNNIVMDVSYVYVYSRNSDVIYPEFNAFNPLISCYSDFKVEFDNRSKKIPKGTNLLIGFPNYFTMPCYCTRPITSKDITVNGEFILNEPPKISDTVFTYLTISIPEDILPYESVKIFIKKDALIKNPEREGMYNLKISIPQYDTPFFSNFIPISSPITPPTFKTNPSTGGRKAEWKIHFTLRGYSLRKGDEIGVAFPFGTYLPNYPEPSFITVNGIPLLKGTKVEKFDSRTYIISIPFDIEGNKDLWIVFKEQIGIKLPLGENAVHGSVYINFDINPINSVPFFIDYVPFLDVEAKLDKEPSLNNYFNSTVVLSLKSNSAILDDDVSIFYSINYGEWIQYTDEIIFDKEGKYLVRYRATDKWGITSDVKKIDFAIDKTPPTFYLEKTEMVSSTKIKYLFKCSEPLSYVTINGFYTICGFSKTFYAVFEIGAFDTLKVHAIDLAGNVTIKEISIKR